jgi:hypothetical protein
VQTCICPVCLAEVTTQPIITVTSIESAEHFVRTSGAQDELKLKMEIERLWGSSECKVFRCGVCESRFAHPHVAGNSNFYQLAFPNSEYPQSRWEFDITKRIASKAVKAGERLLEIGGGSGSFINLALEEGVKASQIVVTEFSPIGAEALRMRGVFVQEVDFREGVSGAPFRVIVLFQALEHLDQLDNALQSLAKLGTSDAEIFISVPNVTYIDWQEKNLNLIDMPPNHITAFSALGLRDLFSRNGWALVKIELEPKKNLVRRYRDNLAQTFTHPSNSFEFFISRLVSLDKVRFRKIRIIILGIFLCTWKFSLIRKVPSESIWIHLERIRNT